MSLTFKGATSFAQTGSAKWTQNLFDLDQLNVEYSGAVAALPAFLASLVKFLPSALDTNMLLTSWRVSDSNKIYPTVDLQYVGPKAGQLPPGQTSSGNSVQTAQFTAGGIPVTITYLAPFTEYRWISTVAGEGSILAPPDITTGQSAIYTILGSASFVFGLLNVYCDTTNMRVGDLIIIPVHNPLLPILPGDIIAAEFFVASITDATHFVPTIAPGATGASYAPNVCTGIHANTSGVTVLNLRLGCGLTGLLTGLLVDEWGPIIIATYCDSMITPSTQSEEIIPGRYWQNVQRNTVSLIPIPC